MEIAFCKGIFAKKYLLKLILCCWICMCITKVSGTELHRKIVDAYFQNRRNMSTSNLGTILFKNIDPHVFANRERQSKIFIVVLWMMWSEVVASYLRTTNYDSASVTQEILQNCNVKNCIYFSSFTTDVDFADAVIVTTENHMVPLSRRDPKQRWILWSQGSPTHMTTRWSNRGIASLSGYFNWTMGYRSDSDIPVPFGRTIALPAPIEVNYLDDPELALAQLVPYWHKKQSYSLAMALVSNCKWDYSALTSLMKIDIYWKSCPKDISIDCLLPEKYLFFLAFEDASCLQYLSESVYHHAYSKGAIPVIRGPPIEDCERLLPPNSFLHVNLYEDIPDLVKHMKEISRNYVSLLTFHAWRQHFAVVSENGFFNTTSKQLCRVCEALNFNDGGQKIYDIDDLHLFYNDKLFCNLTYKCDEFV